MLKSLVLFLQGALVSIGAALPGVSGGVMCVLFGIYKPIMRLLAHPIREIKQNKMTLIPILVGYVIGYVGIARLISDVMESQFRTQAMAAFVGLTIGILPSLFREAGEQGRSRKSWVSFGVVFAAAMALLSFLKLNEIVIVPNFAWNAFCGVALALSIIAPGMSSSVLLMPLNVETMVEVTEVIDGVKVPVMELVNGIETPQMTQGIIDLYTHTMDAVGNFDFAALIPVAIGAVLTIVLMSKFVNWLLDKHYSVMFHGIVGIVIASTIFVFIDALTGHTMENGGDPFGVAHVICMVVCAIATLLLDKLNQKVEKPAVED